MGLVETEAIVLRTYNLSEADKIVVCLTRSAGVVRAVARGARRLKSRFGASLEPSTLLNLSYYEKEGRELVSLRHAEILRSYFSLSQSTEAVVSLAYMSELIIEFVPPHEPNERFFRMVRACVEALADSPMDQQAVVRYFEIWTLKLAGFLPDMHLCAGCGERLGRERETIYLNSECRPHCQACSDGLGTALSGEAYEQLRAIRRLSPHEFARTSRGASTHQEIAQVARRLIGRVLEKELRAQAALT